VFGGYAGTSLGWIPSIQADALLIFILLMEAAMPSAQNTVVILQVPQQTVPPLCRQTATRHLPLLC
jgi:hypothetical protein